MLRVMRVTGLGEAAGESEGGADNERRREPHYR